MEFALASDVPRSSTQQSEQYHGPKMHVRLSPPFRFDSLSWPWILGSQVLDSDKECSGRCVNRLLASSHYHHDLDRTTPSCSMFTETYQE